jgi:hypothetical protein
MPHLAGHCDCGRQIHFPNDAALGHEWRCFKCGKVWTLSTQGKPLQNRGSKPPPVESSVSPQGKGCLPVLLFIGLPALAISAWWLAIA